MNQTLSTFITQSWVALYEFYSNLDEGINLWVYVPENNVPSFGAVENKMTPQVSGISSEGRVFTAIRGDFQNLQEFYNFIESLNQS